MTTPNSIPPRNQPPIQLSGILGVHTAVNLLSLYYAKSQQGQRHGRLPRLKRCLRSSSSHQSLNEPPLLIYFDDYLGNDQRSILETTTASQSAHILAKYYGIGYVSFADVVRDIVYRQTNETIFSPHGWYGNGKDNDIMQREVHPGYGMHIASSFVLAWVRFILKRTLLSSTSSGRRAECACAISRQVSFRFNDDPFLLLLLPLRPN